MAGWHKYMMTFTLTDGRVVKEEMSGLREDCLRVCWQNGPELPEFE